MGRPRALRNQDGFTIIEVMVAAMILLVGILGVTTIVNTANGTTTSNKAREQGLALARELVESARSVRYQALRPSTVVASLQGMSGFANAGGPGWTIKRRGVTYTVSVGVCSVDDPGDGTGAHTAGNFCARPGVTASAATCQSLIGVPARINGTGAAGAGADAGDCGLDTNLDGQVDGLVQDSASDCPSGTTVAAGTCDSQPDDFKRLVTLVTWDRGAGSRYVLQQATVPFPGLAAYGAITSITPDVGSQSANGYTVSSKVASLTFTANSDQAANQVNWLLDGVDQGPTNWSGTTGNFTWDLGNAAPDSETQPALGEVLDGTYLIGARVQDAAGIHGNEMDIAVTLNRRAPFPPTNLNLITTSSSVTATWDAPPDHDIASYTVYRSQGSGSPTPACTATAPALSCTDTSPPSGAPLTYYVTAVDTFGGESLPSNTRPTTLSAANSRLVAPTWLTKSVTGNSVTLTWNALPGAQRYFIYRDNPSTPITWTTGTTYTEKVANNTTYTYWVSGIDSQSVEGYQSAGVSVTT